MKISILGTDYEIVVKKYSEDDAFERTGADGYCDGLLKKIVLCDMDTYKGWENEPAENRRAEEKSALRHEIVHAFFNESGLMSCTHESSGGVFRDEELVDWIAQQGPKIYAAWERAGCLP